MQRQRVIGRKTETKRERQEGKMKRKQDRWMKKGEKKICGMEKKDSGSRKREGWDPVISLPELLATLPLNFTHRWKTCSFVLSSRHSFNHSPTFSHVPADTHALPPDTYAHIHRLPPCYFTTFIVLFSVSPSIWLPYEEPQPAVKNYCTSAPIYTTLYKPRVGPAKVSGPTFNTW